MTTTALTAATVSRVLGKAHPRSERTTTRVRGYYAVSAGFTTSTPSRQSPDWGRIVYVEHHTGNGLGAPRRGETRDYIEASLSSYAATLARAGYVTEQADNVFGHPRLVVRRAQEG